jgi:hypothetical protein
MRTATIILRHFVLPAVYALFAFYAFALLLMAFGGGR